MNCELRIADCGLWIRNDSIRNPKSRAAFTLLEVLLAIAITLLVMSLVGAALFMQLRTIEETHHEVGQAQLARALLRHMGDDLRNVIKYDPLLVSLPSSSSAAGSAASAAAAVQGALGGATGQGASGQGASGQGATGQGATGQGAKSGGAQSGGGGLTQGLGQASSLGGGATGGGAGASGGMSGGASGGSSGGGVRKTSGASQAGTSMAATTAGTTEAGTNSSATESKPFSADAIPGVRGDFHEQTGEPRLKVDISLLPRRDQLQAADQGSGRAGDVKSVTYFVEDGVGLVRDEVSRADSQAAMEQGNQEELMQSTAKVLAPEVVRVRFEYYDGEQWSDIWPTEAPQDETAAARLPLAVHVVLYLKPRDFDQQFAGQSWASLDVTNFPQRRMIVPLPTAELPDESTGATGANSGSNSSKSSSGSSPSSSSSSNASGSGATGAGGGR